MPDQKDIREIRISPALVEQMMREGIPAVGFNLPADIKLEGVEGMEVQPSELGEGYQWVTLRVSSEHFPPRRYPADNQVSVIVSRRD